MAATIKYCALQRIDYYFWMLTDTGKVALKRDFSFRIIDLLEHGADPRIMKMIADPKLKPVMKGDILRFFIVYALGGFYADEDMEIFNIQEVFYDLPYVCGYERERNGAGRPGLGLENKPVCTGFFGAPPKSPINEAMVKNILDGYDKMVSTGKYPADMWDVIALTVDPLTRICRQLGANPFPMEYFFPYPPPPPTELPPFSIHYYAGTEPGGWSFDQCKYENCATCQERSTCKISRHGRRL